MRKLLLAPALVVPVLAVAAAALAPVPDASAKPEYAKKEGKDCSFCHLKKEGGGPKTPKGEEYAKNGHKFLPEKGEKPSKPGFGEDGAFKTDASGKQYGFVLAAIQYEHWQDALRRIADLQSKEDKKGPAADKLAKQLSVVDGKGRDLVRAAKESIQGGKAPEAAAALARVEIEFKGRDVAKDVTKPRADLLKLPGGKDADAKAHAEETLRLMLLDAKMKCAENDTATATKLLTDLLAKSPEGPFSAEAKAKLDELKSASGDPAMGAAMGG